LIDKCITGKLILDALYKPAMSVESSASSVIGSSIESVLSRIPQVRVTVFGDYCLDAYWWLDDGVNETSLETGLAPRHIRRQRYTLGGAGNVIANLVDLGVQKVRAVGAVGADLFGCEILRQLEILNADTSGLLVLNEDWQTFVYAKPYVGQKEDRRFDFGFFNTLSDYAKDRLIEGLEGATSQSDVVLINQQIPSGITTPEIVSRVNKIIEAHPNVQFIVDSRHYAALYRGVMLKLNDTEAINVANSLKSNRAAGVIENNGDRCDSTDLAKLISTATGHPVFLTRGANGLLVADQHIAHEIPGVQVMERTDPVGAGDTVAAALASVVGCGGGSVEAARLANLAASVTVRKLQVTGTATPSEILKIEKNANYVYRPELAEDIRLAQYFSGTEIELIEPLPDDIALKHVIFDHDGTISTLREGWERIMEPMMVKAILGASYARVDNKTIQKIAQTASEFIDKTTGIQTLIQMQGLVRLVREHGFVDEKDILDEHGYKRVYNEGLLELVRGRIDKLEAGELDPADFQLKNAARFLRFLHWNGVRLYLASGTDEEDVQQEAEALGYADVFEGRIFGAVGDVNVEAKRIVIERIIREHNLGGHEFAIFGDGPVEIQEAKRKGGVCVGVASDEVRRFGINQTKRRRLIRAGAQVIIPDFSQITRLATILGFDAEVN
jgi:rfaE bifunctional protein kinase chain/domain